MTSLANLLEYDILGEQNKFYRDAVSCLWALATEMRLDKNGFRPYTERLFESTYKNPFEGQETQETGESIINHLLGRG